MTTIKVTPNLQQYVCVHYLIDITSSRCLISLRFCENKWIPVVIITFVILIVSLSIKVGLPGVLGNKGTWPLTFREQGNKRKIKLGTREQKHI